MTMQPNRRELFIGLMALSACSPVSGRKGDVFAAGQPAAILVYVLAPERLLGWPRRPTAAALALLPASADLPELGALTSGGAPTNMEAVAAQRPSLILDYGDTDANYRATAERIRSRINAPYELIDGALINIPRALAQGAELLDLAPRGARLSTEAARILARWSALGKGGPSFYYARGRDGLETGFAGSLATGVLEGGGWTNVAGGGNDVGRVSHEQVVAWDPELVVTLDARFAQMAALDPFWHRRRNGRRRRLLLLPELPFGWIDRPPSVNRLLGCAWLADEALFSSDHARLHEASAKFAELFYGARPGVGAAPSLTPRWFA